MFTFSNCVFSRIKNVFISINTGKEFIYTLSLSGDEHFQTFECSDKMLHTQSCNCCCSVQQRISCLGSYSSDLQFIG